MKQAIKEVLDIAEWMTAILFVVVILVSLVIWILGQEALRRSVPILVYTLVGVGCIAAVYWLVTYLIARFYSTRRVVAEQNRDTILARNEGHLSNISIRRSEAHLEIEAAAAWQQLRQMGAGTVYVNRLGEVEFTSHTRAAITANDSAPQLPAPTDLPTLVRIEDYVQPGNVTLRNLVLGVGPNNEVIRGSLRELSHIGVAGTSRWGKSIFLQVLLYQILMAKEKIDLYLSDLGGTTYEDFGISYADDVASTEKMAMNLWDMAMERKASFQATGQGIRSLDIYNQVAAKPLPYVVFACDEVTAVFSESKRLQHTLKNLVLYAGKYGIELILSGQNWKSTNVDSTLRDQFSSRFQFKAMDRYQASMLISDSGADEINVKGRCYAWIPERGETIQMQSPFIETETLRAVARPVHPLLGDDLPVWNLKPENGSSKSEFGSNVESELEPDDTGDKTKTIVTNTWFETRNKSECYRTWYRLTHGDEYTGSVNGDKLQLITQLLATWGVEF